MDDKRPISEFDGIVNMYVETVDNKRERDSFPRYLDHVKDYVKTSPHRPSDPKVSAGLTLLLTHRTILNYNKNILGLEKYKDVKIQDEVSKYLDTIGDLLNQIARTPKPQEKAAEKTTGFFGKVKEKVKKVKEKAKNVLFSSEEKKGPTDYKLVLSGAYEDIKGIKIDRPK